MYTAGCYYIAACSYCLERPKLQYLVNCIHFAQNCTRQFHALENLQLIFWIWKSRHPNCSIIETDPFQTTQIQTVTLRTDKLHKQVKEKEWYSSRKLLNNVSFFRWWQITWAISSSTVWCIKINRKSLKQKTDPFLFKSLYSWGS